MGVVSQIADDLKSAMLARDSFRVETLRGLKSALLYEEVALKSRDSGLTEEQAIAVLKREAKKRKDAIELYKQGKNSEKADKEQSELGIIENYLPELLDEASTEKLVDVALDELAISSPEKKDTGRIIGFVKSKAGASADPALIAKIVNKRLNQS